MSEAYPLKYWTEICQPLMVYDIMRDRCVPRILCLAGFVSVDTKTGMLLERCMGLKNFYYFSDYLELQPYEFNARCHL